MSTKHIDHSRLIAKMICKFNSLVDNILAKEEVISKLSDEEIKSVLFSCHTLFDVILAEYERREKAFAGLRHAVAVYIRDDERKLGKNDVSLQEGGNW